MKKNAKLTSQEISKKTLIPVTTIHNRIKKLEKEGIVRGYTVVVDHKKLGLGILAFVLITVIYILPTGKKISEIELAKTLSKMPLVEETYIVTGGTDIIIKIRVKDIDELNQFVITDLRSIEGVDNTQTIIALSSPDI